MKKNIFSYLLAGLAILLVASCSEEWGTEPGNDSAPVVTLYQYENQTNSDNNTDIRITANNQVTAAYYLAEKKSAYEADLASKGEEGFKQYVVESGKKIDGISGVSTQDLTLTDLFGDYVIAFVAENGSTKTLKTVSFTGLDWADVAKGTYTFANKYVSYVMGTTSVETTLQVCTTDETLFRFKDLYGTGNNLKFYYLPDYASSDDGGNYYFARVKAQATGLSYSSYGPISVRDIGYWQGNDAYVTDYGYNGYYYDNHVVYLYVQYYLSALSSGNNCGYDYDSFVPAE